MASIVEVISGNPVRLTLALVVGLLFAAGLAVGPAVGPARAAPNSFTVTSSGDAPDADTSDNLCRTAENVCTLRAAIQQANATPNGPDGPDGIHLEGTDVFLTRPLPELSTSMNIDAWPVPFPFDLLFTTVRRADGTGDYRIFNVTGVSTTVGIENLRLSGGIAPDSSFGTSFGAECGGAILVGPGSVLNLTTSWVDGNSANFGGGVCNLFGTANVKGTTIRNNQATAGGGIHGAQGSLSVEGSTFSGNVAGSEGGGIQTGGATATITNSTFSGNVAGSKGGGIGAGDGSVTITNSTLSGNQAGNGGGVWVAPRPTIHPKATIRGSIVAGNTATSGNANVEGDYADDGFNVVGGTAAEAGLKTDANGNPVLGYSGIDGGHTETVALIRSSPAIDKGNSFGVAADQRGTPRPKDYASIDNAAGGDGSDVGAFEYVDPDFIPPTVGAHTSPLSNEGAPNNSDVTVAISASDEEGGSGVWRTSYSASGAQQLPEQNVPGNSAELVVSADGETVVTYWATDKAGNRSESRTLTVSLDKTPPATSISSGPSGPTRNTSASFVFSSPEAGATFECRLTGPSKAHDFRDCTSTTGYSALVDGSYTFLVRAKDGLGNADATPAMRTWTVDTARPTGKVLINNGRVSVITRAVTLKLEATDPVPASGVASMRFKNEGSAAWSAWQPYAGSKSWRLTSGAGKKTVYVQYRDRAGNISATASDTITYRP